MSKVGIREIGEATGFSPATVSKALNGKPGVNAETVRTVREAARELGYLSSAQGGALLFMVARKSGRILDDSTFHPAVIDGVEWQTREMGLKMEFATVTLRDDEATNNELENALSDPLTPAVVLATELDDAELSLFAPYKDRIVLLDNTCESVKFDSVVIDNRVSAKSAVRYLVGHGHRKIGYLSCDFHIHNFAMRELGFFEGLKEAGLSFDSRWSVSVGTTLDEVYRDTKRWLEGHGEDALPTAFFADSDLIAVGALRAIREYGLRVPEDISLFGFDDGQLGAFSSPPLSTMHVMRREMGEIAVRRAVGKLVRAKSYSCTTQVQTNLIERESVYTREV